MLDKAIITSVGLEEAQEWVSAPDDSAHVTGDAVDTAATGSVYWFSQFTLRCDLRQTLAREIWHYELVAEPGDRRPEPAADASVE